MMKILLRMLLLPVFALIGIARLVLKLGTKVYSWAIGIFWLLLLLASVMIVTSHQYGQLAIVGGAAVISFAVLFVIMWAEMSLGDLRDFLKSKI
ncbi:MAG: hypothetical protein UHN47_12450 [Lachnospiraceae bacterium]|nr:hypothetical protein [Lachnospiraceae bacterium]